MRPTGKILGTAFVIAYCSCLAHLDGVSSQELANDRSPESLLLPGTMPLQETTPLEDRILNGADHFLDRQMSIASVERHQQWQAILRLPEKQRLAAVDVLRERLRQITGSHDLRVSANPQVVSPLAAGSALAIGDDVVVSQLSWSVVDGYQATGLLVQPSPASIDNPITTTVILCPDADQSLAVLCGLEPSADPLAGQPLRLARAGCRVIIPQPITRHVEKRGGRIDLTDREYVYRATFVQGRHPLGIEIQSVLSLVDWFKTLENPNGADQTVAVMGDGEGGLVAMLAAAMDPRIDSALLSGVWGNRNSTWQEPISRNVFGLLSNFGDASLACMIAPRKLFIETTTAPRVQITATGASPGRLETPTPQEINDQIAAVNEMTQGSELAPTHPWLVFAESSLLDAFCLTLGKPLDGIPSRQELTTSMRSDRPYPWASIRHQQISQIENLSDQWIRTSRDEREQWVKQLNTESLDKFQASMVPHRERFYNDVIGRFDEPLQPLAARSKFWKRTDKCTLWHVEMDVFPECVGGGILLVPNDLDPTRKHPVVVAVHGLEGRPIDTIEGDHYAYHDFATRMCEQGYIVFAPQQLYLGHDRFRLLQRKANPLGKTLFSIIIPQHQQLIRFLKSLPWVDAERIGFYGLSYGGKSAMRIPAVVEEYCAVICSGDFNEWVLKNGSTRDPFSYVWTPEYEIFEFDLGRTFNYAEMAALICPRPFMVERGHFDGVGIDRWVAFEYAPVRYLYAAKLGIPERTTIEWFVGPHTIHGQGTYQFLQQHLDPSKN